MVTRRFVVAAMVVCAGAISGLFSAAGIPIAASDDGLPQLVADNSSGRVRTLDVNGELDLSNPFFQVLGTNGRACFSCHRPEQGWTITPEPVQKRFLESRGLDPIFRPNDGSNCEGADVSSVGKRLTADSMLLTRGLIRVGIDVPVDAEFVIDSVDDPYGCGAPLTAASMYRRPLPTPNPGFLSGAVGRRGIIADHDHPGGSRQASRRCDDGPCAGLAPSDAAGGPGDRRV